MPTLKNLDSNTNEQFAGRHVKLADDSMLTTFALLEGRAVHQPTAFAFAAVPENISHHLRQYLRWMGGVTMRFLLPTSGVVNPFLGHHDRDVRSGFKSCDGPVQMRFQHCDDLDVLASHPNVATEPRSEVAASRTPYRY